MGGVVGTGNSEVQKQLGGDVAARRPKRKPKAKSVVAQPGSKKTSAPPQGEPPELDREDLQGVKGAGQSQGQNNQREGVDVLQPASGSSIVVKCESKPCVQPSFKFGRL